MKRIHAELIIAWADGAQIQVLVSDGGWEDNDFPNWNPAYTYRIKPEPKYPSICMGGSEIHQYYCDNTTNLSIDESMYVVCTHVFKESIKAAIASGEITLNNKD